MTWEEDEVDEPAAVPSDASTEGRGGSVSNDGRYDVIIIGSGAGGGTLARHLAPSGKRILLLERGDWLPREIENWDPSGSSSTTATSPRTPGTTPTASRSSRRSTTTSAAPPSSTAPPSTGCARRTSASSATTTASPRRGRSPTTTSSRTTRRPSGSTRCTATPARTRPRAAAASRTRARPCPTSRASSSSSDDLRAGRLPPVPRAVRHPARRGRPTPSSTCIRCTSCDGYPCLVHAKSDAETIGVRPALDHPNVTLLVNAEVTRLDDRRRRHRGRPASSSNATATTETLQRRHRRRLGRRGQLGQAAAALGQRPAPERPRQRLRPGRAATTCSTTARPSWRSRRSPTRRVFQKTLGLNDFYFGMPGFDCPMGNIQMVGKSQRRDVQGREAARDQARARLLAGRGRDATRSTSGCPPRTCRSRTTASRCRRDGNIHLDLHAQQPGAQEAALPPAQDDAQAPRHAPRHLSPRTPT